MFLTNAQRWNLNVLNMFLNRLDVITMFSKKIKCNHNVPIGHILETCMGNNLNVIGNYM